MPRQNLSPEDLSREVRTTFARLDAGDASATFCDHSRGMLQCSRPKGHNGRHAVGRDFTVVSVRGVRAWYPTRVVRW